MTSPQDSELLIKKISNSESLSTSSISLQKCEDEPSENINLMKALKQCDLGNTPEISPIQNVFNEYKE